MGLDFSDMNALLKRAQKQAKEAFAPLPSGDTIGKSAYEQILEYDLVREGADQILKEFADRKDDLEVLAQDRQKNSDW